MHRPDALVALHHSLDPTSIVSVLRASLLRGAAAAQMLVGQLLRTRWGLLQRPRTQDRAHPRALRRGQPIGV